MIKKYCASNSLKQDYKRVPTKSVKILLISAFICLFHSASCLFAFAPETKLSNLEQENQAQEIFAQTRCLLCQGQAITDSDSQFAFNLRQEIRQKIKNGATSQEIMDELVAEFGEEILLTPSKSVSISIFLTALTFSSIFLIWARMVKKPKFKQKSPLKKSV